MTAFLFIPSTGGTAIGRRLDLAQIANQFSDVEEPTPRADRARAARIALMIIILLGAIGDTVLVTRPDVLASSAATIQPMSHTLAGRVTKL